MRHRKPVSQSMRPLGSFLRSKLEFDAGISSHRRVDLVKLLCALNRHLNRDTAPLSVVSEAVLQSRPIRLHYTSDRIENIFHEFTLTAANDFDLKIARKIDQIVESFLLIVLRRDCFCINRFHFEVWFLPFLIHRVGPGFSESEVASCSNRTQNISGIIGVVIS